VNDSERKVRIASDKLISEIQPGAVPPLRKSREIAEIQRVAERRGASCVRTDNAALLGPSPPLARVLFVAKRYLSPSLLCRFVVIAKRIS